MHRRRFLQLIDEMNDEPVADARLDQRAGEATVIRPGAHALAGSDLDFGELRGQRKFNDVGIGIGVPRLGELHPVGPSSRCERLRLGANRNQRADGERGQKPFHECVDQFSHDCGESEPGRAQSGTIE
jgi:hypothetical protein